MDYRKRKAAPVPLYRNGNSVVRVPHFKLLGTSISEDLPWSVNATEVDKKDQQ